LTKVSVTYVSLKNKFLSLIFPLSKKLRKRNSMPLVQISRKNKKKKGMESHRQTERERQTSGRGVARSPQMAKG
jgi:hypothetical protein